MGSTQKNLLLVACVTLVVVPGFYGLYVWSGRVDRVMTPAMKCFGNLRLIEGAKQLWALEQNKATNDIPAWDDLRSSLEAIPTCPSGGTYTIGSVGEPPICSISEHTDHWKKYRPQK